VVFDKDEESVLTQTTQLFDYGFQHFYNGILVSKDVPLRTINVEGIEINLVSKIDIYYTYPIGQSYIKNITFTKNEKLALPIKTDTVAGVIKYTLEDGTEIDVDLYSDREVVAPEDYKARINKILEENRDLVIIVIILLMVELILVLHHIIKNIKKLIKKMGRPT